MEISLSEQDLWILQYAIAQGWHIVHWFGRADIAIPQPARDARWA